MKNLTFFLAHFKITIALCLQCYGFADWQTKLVIPDAPPLALNTKKTEHHSHAVGNGTVYIAYVLRAGGKDLLYFSKKNLYESPAEGTSASPPILIDSADGISSIQIRHSRHSGVTHFSYSSSKASTGNLLPPTISLKHASFKPKSRLDQIPITITTISTNVGFPFPSSLDIRTTGNPTISEVGLAYVSPVTKSLYYSEPDGNGNWNGQLIDPDSSRDIIECDLAFGTSDSPEIAYSSETSREKFTSILHASRNQDGSWFSIHVFGNTSSSSFLSGLNPSLFRVGDSSYLTFINRQEYATSTIFWLPYGVRHSPTSSFTFIGTGEGVHVSSSPPLTSPLANPEIIASEDRIVIAYQKSISNTSENYQSWLSVHRSNEPASTATLARAPTAPGIDTVTLENAPALSLDHNGYPVVTWTNETGSDLQACFCPDFTDYDQDGVPYLQEKAFQMNPDLPDSHFAPWITTCPSQFWDGREFFFSSRVHELPTNNEDGTFHTDTFSYTIQESSDLKNWQTAVTPDYGIFKLVGENPPMIQFGFTLLDSDNRNQLKYFRTHVFRR